MSDQTKSAKPYSLIPFVLAMLWLGFALLELVLGERVIHSNLYNCVEITLSERLTLVCQDLTALALVVLPFGVSLVALIGIVRRAPARRRLHLAAMAGVVTLTFVFLQLYMGSWALYSATGHFLDFEILVMWAANPILVTKHVLQMEAGKLLAVCAIAATGTGLLTALLFKASSGIERGIARRAASQIGVAALLCAAVALMGNARFSRSDDKIDDDRADCFDRAGDLYGVLRDEQSGPFSHALANLLQQMRMVEDIHTSATIPLERKPQIGMDDYLANAERGPQKPYNVIVLLVESLRADQIQACGGGRVVMPNVEALAAESRVFKNCYSVATLSEEADLCPLSSQYPLRGWGWEPYPVTPSYPRVLIYDILKKLGYNTAVFSSQNEYWGGMYNYLNTGSIDHFLHAETFDGPTRVPRGDGGFASWVKGNKRAGKIDDRFTVMEAMQWIGALDTRPFFIYMNLQESHVPYEIPTDFPRRFGPGSLDFSIGFNCFPKEKAGVVKNVYADSLAYVDLQIGRLIKNLKNEGLWDKTILVLVGDHGEAFFEHGFAAHGNELYNELLKVPLIIRAPGLEPGVDNEPAQHIDVPPSICHLLGLAPHPGFQGLDLFSGQSRADRSIYLVSNAPFARQYGIVRGDFKLIYDRRMNRYLLFDLATDPEERHDLSGARPDVVRRLTDRLNTWRKVQINYYADSRIHRREYPPVVVD